ncbi:alpha/beta hydrolase [Streptomyces sp. NPDC017405]|uniref:alpha/beta hydrolase n=1 Tax=unclassified Streptomyces TaxID=2593676 RepID=UPI00379EEAC1
MSRWRNRTHGGTTRDEEAYETDLATLIETKAHAARTAPPTVVPALAERLTVTEHRVPGPPGGPGVRVRVFRPREATGRLPGVLWIHGGGFVLGSIDAVWAPAAATALGVGAVVVTAGYRLAPDHVFPAALDDCYATLCWLADEAPGLGVDVGRIGVLGVSSGGALAAGVALLARDLGGPAVCFQHLSTPVLDDRADTPSMLEFEDTPVWNAALARQSWRYYLGDAPGPVSAYAAPARAEDLSGLPPAYIATAEFDPLRDEGILYGLRLLQAGVPVELHSYPEAFHGFGQAISADVGRRSGQESLDALRRGLAG